MRYNLEDPADREDCKWWAVDVLLDSAAETEFQQVIENVAEIHFSKFHEFCRMRGCQII